MTADPFDILSSLRLDSGDEWGSIALPFQRDDARALLDVTGPRLHYWTRPRGASKSTDIAGCAVSALLTQAPPASTSHCFARDKDQAAILLDAVGGMVQRSRLAGMIEVQSWQATVRSSGARLVIESADAASAFGALPFLVVADELAQWPSTRSTQSLWEALVSGLVKRPDSRLVCATTAGDPIHFSRKVLESARQSPRWRVSEIPGPLPWADPDDLAEQQRLLPVSAYARLHLNRWTSPEDRLVSLEDLAACVTLDGPQEPKPNTHYYAGLDLGIKNDRTVLAVCHAEGSTIVLDRLAVFAGTANNPVQLADVESAVEEAAHEYHCKVRCDPWQATGLAQRLRAKGVWIEEWTFSPSSIGRLAINLHLLLREHRLALPDDPELLDELQSVRLYETRPGVLRLDHDASRHDDRAVALGLACLALVEKPSVGRGSLTVPHLLRPNVTATTTDAVPRLPAHLAARQAARRMPAGVRGIPLAGTANDPERVIRRRT